MLAAAFAFGACTTTAGRYPPEPPLWRDPDRRPFSAQLTPYYSPHDWDRLEKTFILPVRDVLGVRTAGEAVNVNTFDEVPDSSWFINRAGLSPADAARGPCTDDADVERGPWLVTSAKPDGATPGFVFKAASGQRYIAKLDPQGGSPRASIADVLGSRIYHAAGYRVPCDSIAHFDASALHIEPGARIETELGEKVPLTPAHLERILSQALRRPDGRYRSLVSRYLEGRPLGPWRYHGLRPGDRNDVVSHEDRRELRGARVLAAWTDHVDQREGNTLAMWREAAPGHGYVLHHLIDFGDCFGSLWGMPAQESWRRGHDYWIDPRTILADWATLGLIERPWDRATLGPQGLALGYYDVESFDPEAWRPRYPNPAFSRMTEHDAAWMARIIARLGPDHISAMLEPAQAPEPLRSALLAIVLGRREALLARYLTRLSPLAAPELRRGAGGNELCVTDLSVLAGVAEPQPYRASLELDDADALAARETNGASGSDGESRGALDVRRDAPATLCVRLPAVPRARAADPAYVVVVVAPRAADAGPAPIRFHAYTWGDGRWLIAGIERDPA